MQNPNAAVKSPLAFIIASRRGINNHALHAKQPISRVCVSFFIFSKEVKCRISLRVFPRDFLGITQNFKPFPNKKSLSVAIHTSRDEALEKSFSSNVS